MKRWIFILAIVLVVSVLTITPSAYGYATKPGVTSGVEAHLNTTATLGIEAVPVTKDGFQSSPIMFIENVGQWDDGARFQIRGGPTGTMWLADDAIWITVLGPEETNRQADKVQDSSVKWSPEDHKGSVPRRRVNIKLSFVGANPRPRIETFDRVDTIVSYFRGSDPNQWRPQVPVWGSVRYVDLYPGIDLRFSSEASQLALTLMARRGADLGAVQMRVDGAVGVAVHGRNLRLSTTAGEYFLPLIHAPVPNDEPIVIARGDCLFDVSTPFEGALDASQLPLLAPDSPTANPADLLYGTFLGGGLGEASSAIVVDGVGSAYVTGWTWSDDFPATPGARATKFDSWYSDAFLVKLRPAGNALAYVTFLGGNGEDNGHAIFVDGVGSAYVTGYTGSDNFPTTPAALDTSFNGYLDAFVAKLNPAGSALAYSTFLGGGGADGGNAIALDGAGSAYVTGYTDSVDFPVTAGAFDTSYDSGSTCGTPPYTYPCLDAYVAKLNLPGSALAYATFLGAGSDDGGRVIVVDGAGSAYIGGWTSSDNFPATPGAFDRSYNGGYDAFIAKLNPAGSALAYATFLGGSGDDWGLGMAVDVAGSAYVTGSTGSSNFPTTPDSFDTSYNGNGDAYVAKLDPAGSTLAYTTFLGGSDLDADGHISVDETGSAYVTGATGSSDFPTTSNAFDTSYNGGFDAYLARLDPVGSALTYATFLGGSLDDGGTGIVVDGTGSSYVIGVTRSTNFPTTSGAFDTSYNGNDDAFVAKLAMGARGRSLYLPLVVQDPIMEHADLISETPSVEEERSE